TAGTEIKDDLAGFEFREGSGIAASERCEKSRFRHGVGFALSIKVGGDRVASFSRRCWTGTTARRALTGGGTFRSRTVLFLHHRFDVFRTHRSLPIWKSKQSLSGK